MVFWRELFLTLALYIILMEKSDTFRDCNRVLLLHFIILLFAPWDLVWAPAKMFKGGKPLFVIEMCLLALSIMSSGLKVVFIIFSNFNLLEGFWIAIFLGQVVFAGLFLWYSKSTHYAMVKTLYIAAQCFYIIFYNMVMYYLDFNKYMKSDLASFQEWIDEF